MTIPEDYASKIKKHAKFVYAASSAKLRVCGSRKIIYNSVLIIDFFYIYIPNLVRTTRLWTATLRRGATNAETCVLM